MITNRESGTTVDEIASGIYRINTPVVRPSGGFTFNQYLVVDDQPLLFHTGLRKLFPVVREAIAAIMPVERLRYISFSHYEADECGALNDFLAVAPEAVPLCGAIAARVSIGDFADRAPQPLADGARVTLGTHVVRWIDAPHVPHGWECGFLHEETTNTLLCSDLFTQPGTGHPVLTDGDILGPSEAFRGQVEYYAHAPHTGALIERLAAIQPTTLACMHGSAWRGDGGVLLRALAKSVTGSA
ncbi:MAG: MBL fold metallo-hydrolase [Proteobacteria bacterium]|nr:MBL fold metallo-hydrolase [Pseudomonadota bacterium]